MPCTFRDNDLQRLMLTRWLAIISSQTNKLSLRLLKTANIIDSRERMHLNIYANIQLGITCSKSNA